jgi:hypothetical protein
LDEVEKELLKIISSHIEVPKAVEGDSVQNLIASGYEKLLNEQNS